MPRKRLPPRLYIDSSRGEWVIRDGTAFVRTGCIESDIEGAERRLREYLAGKHQPEPSPAPLIADVMLVYLREHVAHTRSLRSNISAVQGIAKWWGDKRVSDITQDNCRAYVASKGRAVAAGRHDLEALRAAVNYWHRSSTYGPLDRLPSFWFPPKSEPRDRWLTEHEFKRLLAAAGPEHLKRFLLIGWYTGTRPGAILELQWSWIDLKAGVMRRRAPGEAEHAKKRRPMVRLGTKILAHLKRWKAGDGPHGRYVVH
jgi:integrase